MAPICEHDLRRRLETRGIGGRDEVRLRRWSVAAEGGGGGRGWGGGIFCSIREGNWWASGRGRGREQLEKSQMTLGGSFLIITMNEMGKLP